MNRKILDNCSPNSIFFTIGDNITIPLWYLQTVENYRQDVAVVDVGMLNSMWYPSYLLNKGIVDFDLPKSTLDTLEFYNEWSNSVVTINNFSWLVKPTYYDRFLSRADIILLSLLKQNNFRRDIYFVFGFPENEQIGLHSYLEQQIAVDKLNLNVDELYADKDNEDLAIEYFKLSGLINKNSSDELMLYRMLSYNVVFKIIKSVDIDNNIAHAKRLLQIIDDYVSNEGYVCNDDSFTQIINVARERIREH